jgi:citrate synthase
LTLTSILIDLINMKAAVSWLTAEQALKFLGIRPQTLYANVSRRRIRVKPDPADSRRSLYHSADVARLAGRRRGRRPAAVVAAQTIGFGDPILASEISTVADGRLWYRGRDVVALSQLATLEEVAVLLWPGDQPYRRAHRPHQKPIAGATALQRAMSAMAVRAAVDPPLLGRAPAVLRSEAAALSALLQDALLAGGSSRDAVHQRCAAVWGVPRAADTIRRSLVLLADHELNASTFAVRVAASTGAALPACLLAGLATLTGPHHGGAAQALQSLVGAARRNGAKSAVREWLTRGERIPAFGHPLYPDGDVRATALMDQFRLSSIFAELRTVAADLTGELVNIDFALAAMADALALPEQTPFVIFALSRSVGWIAHALEQVATGGLIRPRARYIGPALIRETP